MAESVEFQFHIGSIKNLELKAKSIYKKEFQFHIGSIKNFQSELNAIQQTCFNSTLVQLKTVP